MHGNVTGQKALVPLHSCGGFDCRLLINHEAGQINQLLVTLNLSLSGSVHGAEHCSVVEQNQLWCYEETSKNRSLCFQLSWAGSVFESVAHIQSRICHPIITVDIYHSRTVSSLKDEDSSVSYQWCLVHLARSWVLRFFWNRWQTAKCMSGFIWNRLHCVTKITKSLHIFVQTWL